MKTCKPCYSVLVNTLRGEKLVHVRTGQGSQKALEMAKDCCKLFAPYHARIVAKN